MLVGQLSLKNPIHILHYIDIPKHTCLTARLPFSLLACASMEPFIETGKTVRLPPAILRPVLSFPVVFLRKAVPKHELRANYTCWLSRLWYLIQ